MKNNVPEEGDIVIVNEKSLDEMEVIKDKDAWYQGDLLRGELRVDRVEDFGVYFRIRVSKTTPDQDLRCGILVVTRCGYPVGVGGRKMTEPLLLLAHDKRSNISVCSSYCSCPAPNLVTNTVLGQSFQYCRSCKKEKA